MRPSGLTNPRKFWGKINRDLKKGDYISIVIKINYNMSSYEGKKIIFSNSTVFGGKKIFWNKLYCGWMSKYSLRNIFSYWK